MPHPVGGYRNKAGKRVRGVTTTIGRYKESGGLIHWAWNLGIEGKDYREVRDSAAQTGNLAHDMIEARIKQEEFTGDTKNFSEEEIARAEKSFTAFERWAESTKLKPVETEFQLVSEVYQFGGCGDAMSVDGEVTVLDWKTSGDIYAEQYVPQVAAYAILWDEHHPDLPVTGGGHIIRFSKESGAFHHLHVDGEILERGKKVFLAMHHLYDELAFLKKL